MTGSNTLISESQASLEPLSKWQMYPGFSVRGSEGLTYIHLIRHGQAGSRDNYDVLSELGQQQARLAGIHLGEHGLKVGAVISGAMNRQRLTAEGGCRALSEAGLKVPDIVTDPRWNEFSLATVYRGLAPTMAKESEEFARDLSEMQEAIKIDPHTIHGATGRTDLAVIRAWMEARYPDYQDESWLAFRTRIREAAAELPQVEPDESILVFTSATPVTITTCAALGVEDDKILWMLGVLFNAGISSFRLWEGRLRLVTFNSIAHLPPELRTNR